MHRLEQFNQNFIIHGDPSKIIAECVSFGDDDLNILNQKRNRNDVRLKVIEDELILTEKKKILLQNQLNATENKKNTLKDLRIDVLNKQKMLSGCINMCHRQIIDNQPKGQCAYCLQEFAPEMGCCRPCGHVYCFECVTEAAIIHDHYDEEQQFECAKCRQPVEEIIKIFI